MSTSSRRTLTWTVVLSAIVFIVAYDGWQLWTRRPQPCDLTLQDCPPQKTCSAPTPDGKARCLPLSDMPGFTFDVPFLSGQGVRCLTPPRDGQFHTTDFNSFALLLAPLPSSSVVVAAREGRVFVRDSVVRILHEDGYYSRYQGLSKVLAKSGEHLHSGETLGELGNDRRLQLSVHFVNPQTALDVLATSQHDGFSVPFVLSLSLEPRGKKQVRDFPVTELECGEASPFKFYRVQ